MPGPVGVRRTREGADLRFTNADGAFYRDHLFQGATSANADDGYIHLINPSIADIEDGIKRIRDYLRDEQNHEEGREIGVGIGYFGHGEAGNGAWVLPSSNFTATDLTAMLSEYLPAKEFGHRSVDLFLDSCFSGAFLAEFLASQSQPNYSGVHVYDAFAATMPDEEAWEIDDLEHGAFTYTLKNQGNRHYSQDELAQAVKTNDIPALRRYLQGFVPNPVTFLTEGDQHSLDVDKYRVRVMGGGETELPDRAFSADELIAALCACRTAADHEVVPCPVTAG